MSSDRGYTVFEVMIVLTVSAVIFFSAVSLFSGRQQRTQFSEFMYELQSKIQQYANQVSTGTFPNTMSYACTFQNNGSPVYDRPYLLPAGGGSQQQSTSKDCIYIGKVIVAQLNEDEIYTYDVLGLRTIHNAAGDSGVNATLLAKASPELAMNSARNQILLYEKYTFIPGVSITSVKYYGASGAGQRSDILQLYNSFQNTAQAATALTIPNYSGESSPNGSTVDTSVGGLRDCIELLSPCANPVQVGASGWRLCLKDSGAASNQKAELTVLGSATGITTKLAMGSCSP